MYGFIYFCFSGDDNAHNEISMGLIGFQILQTNFLHLIMSLQKGINYLLDNFPLIWYTNIPADHSDIFGITIWFIYDQIVPLLL